MTLKITAIIALLVASQFATAARINLTFDETQFQDADGQEARGAFLNAANFWQELLLDDIDVNLSINFESLDPNVLGGASSRRVVYEYQNVVSNMIADGTSNADAYYAANQPFACDDNGNGCDNIFRDGTSSDPTIDNDNSNDNRFMSLTSANAKALGFDVTGAQADGDITFNSDFSFDYNPDDGITEGTFDFVSVAVHEIGHTLGFVSGVDIIDQNPDVDLNPFAYINTLDLFRFSDSSGIIDLRAGVDSFFSLDGGINRIIDFSTGVNMGDGRQASHFKDNVNAGIMDPTFAPGESGVLSEFDVLAFDVIGWDFAQAEIASEVSAPATGFLLLSSLGFILYRRRLL